MAFKTRFETPEAEAVRLAQSPEGSTNHALSSMPVNIRGNITEGMLIQVPAFADEDPTTHSYVVMPITAHPLTRWIEPELDPLPRRRYNRSWDCIVVASNHPRVPVGGYRVSLPEYQLVRGTLRTLTLPGDAATLGESPLTIQSAIDTGLLTVGEPIAATEKGR
jgi:hypothetical protein